MISTVETREREEEREERRFFSQVRKNSGTTERSFSFQLERRNKPFYFWVLLLFAVCRTGLFVHNVASG